MIMNPNVKNSIELLKRNDRVKFVDFDDSKDILNNESETTVSFKLAFKISNDSDVHSPVMVFTFKLKNDSLFSPVECKIAIEKSVLNRITQEKRNELFNKINSSRGTSKIYLNDIAVIVSSESYVDSGIFEHGENFEDIVMKLANNCIYLTAELARSVFDEV